jgi:phage tail-like protein
MVVPESLPPPQRFAFARDRREWAGALSGFDVGRDGVLTLMALPGPPNGEVIVTAGPYDVGASGIAAGPCGIVFVADTAHNRIVIVDPRCKARVLIPPSDKPSSTPGGFNQPRGLAVSAVALGVADSGNARLQTLAFPFLEPSLDVTATSAGLLKLPIGVATDSHGRWYLLDKTAARVTRTDAGGFADPVYDAKLATEGAFVAPAFLTVTESDLLLVSDAGPNTVAVFKDDGTRQYMLPAPPGGGWTPRAIAAGGGRIYVHDTTSGTIHVFTDGGQTYCCALPGWVGPVTALAVDGAGNLLIKPGLDDAYYLFETGTAHATSGTLTLGPLDAGEDLEWYRAGLDAVTPAYTTATLEVFQSAADAPGPTPGQWIRAASSDTLLAPLVDPLAPPLRRRWLWLRATLDTRDVEATPILRQARAETPGENYLDYLPAIYSRSDLPARHLDHLLALAKTEQRAVDERVDAMPQLFSPAFAPATALLWLSDWVDFELPATAPDDERRMLVATAIARHERRGTPASIREFVELFTGIRPHIVEGFTQRGLWMLDDTSLLGCDTILAACDPEGTIVPDPCTAHQGDPPKCCLPEHGRVVVGESGPIEESQYGLPLFLDTAYRFDVLVPRHRASDPAVVRLIRRILDREKPAHTQYCLCLFESELRVGLQALVGVDTIVGGSEPGVRLDAARLDFALIGPLDERAPRVGLSMSVGSTALVT